MKRALVLAGGGSKGAYEVGYARALRELDIDYQIVTGTSIGALNGCLLAQQDTEALEKLWAEMSAEKVFEDGFSPSFSLDFEKMLNQSNLAVSFFKKFIKEKGADITPLKKIIKGLLKKEQFLSSPIDFGLCTVHYPNLKPLFITKTEMEQEHIFDYLIASASCFPIFPIHTFNEQSFIDGGYYDNVPIDLALDMGASEVIVVDMNQEATHKHYLNRPHVIYTTPYLDLGSFMDFSRESLDRNLRIGYQTAMKTFGGMMGVKYTFHSFESPLFSDFYRDILYLERSMRSAYRSEAGGNLIYKFIESHKDQPLQEKDYLFVAMDWILTILDRDPTYVYDFEIVTKDILEDFKKYIDQNYQTVSLQSTEEVTRTFKEISKKGMVGRILHSLIYPKEEKIELITFLNLFSKEVVMARLLFLIYKSQ